MKPLLSPRNDTIFKLIFADSRDIEPLSDFLKSVLTIPAEDYEDITLIDPHLTRDGWGGKLGILDIKIKTRSGKLIDVEIQLIEQPGLRERIIFYLSRMIAEQIGEGENYLQIQRSICILIADFTLISENPYYHNRYRLHDSQTGSEFTDLLEVNVLELPKLPRNADGTALWDWLEFLKTDNREELGMLAEKNPGVKKAVAKLMALSEDERARMLADSRQMMEWDIAVKTEAAEERGLKRGREEGLERGLERGREESQRAIARTLLKLGRPVEEVARATGLSVEAVQSLLQ